MIALIIDDFWSFMQVFAIFVYAIENSLSVHKYQRGVIKYHDCVYINRECVRIFLPSVYKNHGVTRIKNRCSVHKNLGCEHKNRVYNYP